MWDDKKEYIFSPLSIPKSNVNVDLGNVYRIYRKTGEMVEVPAASAAEAIEKSGINDAIKIVSMAVVRKQMMDKNIISSLGEDAETNIEVDKDSPTGLGFLFVADEKHLKGESKAEFELFGLGDLANMSEQAEENPPPSEDEPLQKPIESPPSDNMAVSANEEKPKNKAVETAKDNIEKPEAKELTSEEVSDLLSSNDS